MEVISHFSHEHPLILLKQVPTGLIRCNGCLEQLPKEGDDDVYGCEVCKTFFLHKSCAQFPTEIVHKSHEQHSLFLLAKPPADDGYGRAKCYLCKDIIQGFLYHCSLCRFNLDIKCTFKNRGSELVDVKKDLILKHPDHEHPLTLWRRPASFHCNACDVKAKDFSYQCSPCNYWIHRRCALLPSTTKRTDHPHPLSLCFRLPSEYHSFEFYCDVCGKQLNKYQHMWLYYCNLCRYFVHNKCMETNKPLQTEFIITENLLRLPTTDITGELIQQLLLKEIQIFSHKHPLKLSYEPITEDDIDDNDEEELLCDACIQPITSPPYYCCIECKYFLHLPCTKLPSELEYPHHPHTLILGCKARIYDTFSCRRCLKISNGFYFSCKEEGCDFFIDVKCTALPSKIVHETHKHPLSIIRNKQMCSGCQADTNKFEDSYGCDSCQFYLHLGCVMLPRTVSHGYDSQHPLVLEFPPHDYHPRPFDCYECEQEINPRYWLYHCKECDLSFHTGCIPKLHISSGVKCGKRIEISYHDHPLQFVRKPHVNSGCNLCGRNMEEGLAFECETCNFRLCRWCVLDANTGY